MKEDIIKLVCREVVCKNDINKIKLIINQILEDEKNINADIDKIIYIYNNYEKLKEDNMLFDTFIESISEFLKINIDNKFCIKYLINEELSEILQTKNYYKGFKNIENLLHLYNRNNNLTIDERKKYIYGDTYGETISGDLADVMHDFDLLSSFSFSEADNEKLAIKKINEGYENSTIDDILSLVSKLHLEMHTRV